MSSASFSWIDVPVRDVIQYFMGTMGYFTSVAVQLARIMALLGIVWSCIQCAFQTKDVRRMAVDIITKYAFFLLIMSIYPAATAGLKSFALELGRRGSGLSVQTLTRELENYLNQLEKVAENTGNTEADAERLQDAINVQMQLIDNIDNEMRGMSQLERNAYTAIFGNRLQDASAEKERLERRKKSIESSGVNKKINAIKSVLVTDSGVNRTKSYRIDLDMKSPVNGESLGYLSPDALARISLLAGEIMYENEWAFDVVASARKDNVADMTEDELDEYRIAVMDGSKRLPLLKFPVRAFIRLIFVGLCVVALLLTTAGCLLQYVMAIIEYFISTSFCITLVPLMLFEGMSDMSRKVLPTLLAQAVKLALITLCMYFNAYMYIKMAMNQTTSTSPFGWSDAFYIVFSSLLTFSIVVNAPKLAATVLTGQPQLSMGEFVQTAAAAYAGGRLAAHAAGTAKDAAKKTVAGGARQIANRGGDLLAMAGAASGAIETGGGKAAALKAAGGELASRTGKRVQAGLSNFAHSAGNPGGRGGMGGAAPAGAADRLNAGGAYQNNRMNENAAKFVPGARDANNNMIDKRFADTAAMNYADAKNNNGEQYTGSMGLRDYLKTQYNTARAKQMQGKTELAVPAGPFNGAPVMARTDGAVAQKAGSSMAGGLAPAADAPVMRRRNGGARSSVRLISDVMRLTPSEYTVSDA